VTEDGRCAHPGCKRKIGPDRFACDQHWSQLPEGIQYQAWGAWCAGQADPGVAEARMAQAVGQAVAWWRKPVPA
jgi:hypothetical protein